MAILRASRGGSTQVRQSEVPGCKPRSGQRAYFHGVKTSLSTLGTDDVPRGSSWGGGGGGGGGEGGEGGGTIGGKRHIVVGEKHHNYNCRGQRVTAGVWGRCKLSDGVREPSTFLTQNSSNERRKRIERRTIANPKWVSPL